MKAVFRQRWEAEYSRGHLQTPQDLLNRRLSSEDYVDSAILGGYALSDIIHGKIEEHQIAADVRAAFHSQYPNLHSSLVSEVQKLHHDPERLRGLVSGIKGKAFEQQYAEYLNHGHLADGLHAELAEHANNPSWDIAIKDSHGHVSSLLQAKASAAVDYVRHAIDAHPDIDVVLPHDSFEVLSKMPGFGSHLLDSHLDGAALSDHVTGALDHADNAAALLEHTAFQIPVIGILFACGDNLIRYRTGKRSGKEALQNALERSAVSTGIQGVLYGLCMAAAHAGHPLTGGATVPIAIVLRSWYGSWKKNTAYKERILVSVMVARDSRKVLAARPVALLTAFATP